MTERPDRRRGLRVGILLEGLLGLIALAGILFTLSRPPSPEVAAASTGAGLALLGAVMIGYVLRGLHSARYYLDRNGLILTWWPAVHIIPMHAIQDLRPAPTHPGAVRGWRGIRWPGLYTGHAWAVEENRPVLFFATEDLPRQLWVITEAAIYAISPAQPQAFIDAFRERAAMKPTQRLEQTTVFPGWRQRAFWSDRAAWALIGLGALVLWGMWLWLCMRFPGLPPRIPLEGSANALLTSSLHLVRLPGLGALIWALHGVLGFLVHERERPAAYGLWLVGLMVQGLLLGAMLQILR
ncbi:MAG: PH domain-containing protein [Thermoflexus sp.]|jgi:hypothetical protein|uniref:PH domain-containing protein n=1 Tax=Thermoflexus TaxID=1495649 RepID=UPI001C74A9F5|nr:MULTISPECIES: PH domain-containing protein [Thermoflexus]MDT7884392.1 PH domain-containing protein [Thermoflexus sp.]MDT7948043.1 PH domain-containing protein [Thermoflexus sp.]QWK09551.1 MAG: PH domain-containing protein [Thermoflexus hugenholtzii]